MVYSIVTDVHSQFVHCKRNISDIILQQDIVKVFTHFNWPRKVITIFSVIGNLNSWLGGRLLMQVKLG